MLVHDLAAHAVGVRSAEGGGNRHSMMGVVESGEVAGIVAYVDGQPAGWCSMAPRGAFPRLEPSRMTVRIDDQQVWSVVGFFIAKPFRPRGLLAALLAAAVEYAKEGGAKVVEGYPVEPQKDTMPDLFAFTGIASKFRDAGFAEMARRTASRPFMRYFIGGSEAESHELSARAIPTPFNSLPRVRRPSGPRWAHGDSALEPFT